jgi:hypothetical protein
VGTALAYPWTLRLFHEAFTSSALGVALLCLAAAFALPLSNLYVAWRSTGQAAGSTLRRVAFAALAAPPLFVLAGVASGLLHSPIRDVWIWTFSWVAIGICATVSSSGTRPPTAANPTGRLRVLHGISGAMILLFVTFHLANHLTGLFGPDVHAHVMAAGRLVYRSHPVEPVLVGLLLFQIVSGVRLAWRYSAGPLDAVRVVQVGSGAYLAAFILTHLNSAFVSARWVHGTQTDWAWATGVPTGLLADAWNIRLVPHYALGAFFVIAHLFCGLSAILSAHGFQRSTVNRVWWVGLSCAAAVSILITAGLCGLRL